MERRHRSYVSGNRTASGGLVKWVVDHKDDGISVWVYGQDLGCGEIEPSTIQWFLDGNAEWFLESMGGSGIRLYDREGNIVATQIRGMEPSVCVTK